jgi:hypothetical protein
VQGRESLKWRRLLANLIFGEIVEFRQHCLAPYCNLLFLAREKVYIYKVSTLAALFLDNSTAPQPLTTLVPRPRPNCSVVDSMPRWRVGTRLCRAGHAPFPPLWLDWMIRDRVWLSHAIGNGSTINEREGDCRTSALFAWPLEETILYTRLLL